MAKKQTKKVEVQEPQTETVVLEQPQARQKDKPIKDNTPILERGWEIKDRVYTLRRGLSPLTYTIRTSGLFFFDEEKGYERELKYTRNQKTCFVDEMKGVSRPEHVTFRDGSLFVPKNLVVLQKLLSLYHPDLNRTFVEMKPEVEAVNEVADIEMEIKALNAAQSVDIDTAEAIMRVEIGSKVSKMSSKELKRDLLLFAKRNPRLFLELASDDNVVLRNIGIRATEMKIIKLSPDQRTFIWGSNDRKLMTVPFDEHPYSALAAWFKTDEGMEVYSSIEKRLN